MLLLLLGCDAGSNLPLRDRVIVDLAPIVIVLVLVVGGLGLAKPFSQHSGALVDSLSVLPHEVDHSAAVALQVLQVVDFAECVLLARGRPSAWCSARVLLLRHLLVSQLLGLGVVRVVWVLLRDGWAAQELWPDLESVEVIEAEHVLVLAYD